MDGKDLLAVWRGEKPVEPRTVFWRYRRADNTRKAVRDGDWKLVWDNGKEELHNLAEDPSEQKDLLAANAERAAGLRLKLEAWEKEVRAPRLKEYYEQRPQ
jgi:arylsulfatase A-like enzyme